VGGFVPVRAIDPEKGSKGAVEEMVYAMRTLSQGTEAANHW
jgi:hypothetical protein